MSICVFFFKQKTAYELRISDWSSDVCSSDLSEKGLGAKFRISAITAPHRLDRPTPIRIRLAMPCVRTAADASSAVTSSAPPIAPSGSAHGKRSEEHTSELQSLMRISYAVFCLKKKKKNNQPVMKTYDQQ